MIDELKKKKKVNKLKEFAKTVGAGGIKDAVSENTKKNIKKTIKSTASDVAKSNRSIGQLAKDFLTKKKLNKDAEALSKSSKARDAQLEEQTSKRYSKVGVSPIYSNGVFTRNSKSKNKLTEDDKANSKRR